MPKIPNFLTKIQVFSLILAILTSFCYTIGQNDQIHVHSIFYNHKNSKYVHGATLISKLARIGTFWPFLATFGIEIATKLQKMFFKYLISFKTTYTSTKCWCSIQATLFFQDAFLGETQKLSFLLISNQKISIFTNFNQVLHKFDHSYSPYLRNFF